MRREYMSVECTDCEWYSEIDGDSGRVYQTLEKTRRSRDDYEQLLNEQSERVDTGRRQLQLRLTRTTSLYCRHLRLVYCVVSKLLTYDWLTTGIVTLLRYLKPRPHQQHCRMPQVEHCFDIVADVDGA